MFQNIEKKLKAMAKAMAVLGVLAVIAGAVLLIYIADNASLLPYVGSGTGVIMGGFALFVGSFFAYGFGQLIENTALGAPVAPSAPACTVTASTPGNATATAPATANASADEATVVAIATAAIAASRGASACAFKVISITKLS